MKTERELFEEWFKSTKWFTGDNCTPKYKTYRSMLQAWQASAQREGYKLVPVEPTKAMQQSAFDVYEVCDYKNYHLNSGTEVRDMIYKAMIGAAP